MRHHELDLSHVKPWDIAAPAQPLGKWRSSGSVKWLTHSREGTEFFPTVSYSHCLLLLLTLWQYFTILDC